MSDKGTYRAVWGQLKTSISSPCLFLFVITITITRPLVSRVADLLSTTDITLIPTINPDGFDRASEGSCIGDIISRSYLRQDFFTDEFLARKYILFLPTHGKDARNRKIQYSEKTQPRVGLQQTAKIQPQKRFAFIPKILVFISVHSFVTIFLRKASLSPLV